MLLYNCYMLTRCVDLTQCNSKVFIYHSPSINSKGELLKKQYDTEKFEDTKVVFRNWRTENKKIKRKKMKGKDNQWSTKYYTKN